MGHLAEYLGLFGVAFVSATLLPFGSEAVLAAMLIAGRLDPVLLLAAASLGNTLGSCLNWWLGGAVLRFQDRPWFPVSAQRLARAEGWYRRYGRWSLLLSWAPVVGDPLTLAAGVMREPLLRFVLIVGAAKTLRYLAVLGAAWEWM
jgi:membrane protein YqaA with SNARE-associated domain